MPMPTANHAHLPQIEIAGLPALDLRSAQQAIRAAHGPRYHVSDQALWEVAALWGIAPQHGRINPHGVFDPIDETIRIEAGRSYAEIELARAPGGLWAVSTDYHLPNSGAGSAPSVWNRFAFFSRDDARTAGYARLRERFTAIGERDSPDAQAAKQLIAKLQAMQFEQMELF